MFELLSQPEVWISFLTLTFLEIVLGIDNIIFLSILVSRLPKEAPAQGSQSSALRSRWSRASASCSRWSG